MADSLQSTECSCSSKFVLIQHILSTQVCDTGPMVLRFLGGKSFSLKILSSISSKPVTAQTVIHLLLFVSLTAFHAVFVTLPVSWY